MHAGKSLQNIYAKRAEKLTLEPSVLNAGSIVVQFDTCVTPNAHKKYDDLL